MIWCSTSAFGFYKRREFSSVFSLPRCMFDRRSLAGVPGWFRRSEELAGVAHSCRHAPLQLFPYSTYAHRHTRDRIISRSLLKRASASFSISQPTCLVRFSFKTLQARPSLGPTLCEPPLSVLRFLLKRLQVKKFDENKLYCSEILAMLVNGDTDVQKRLGTLQGKSNNHITYYWLWLWLSCGVICSVGKQLNKGAAWLLLWVFCRYFSCLFGLCGV